MKLNVNVSLHTALAHLVTDRVQYFVPLTMVAEPSKTGSMLLRTKHRNVHWLFYYVRPPI